MYPPHMPSVPAVTGGAAAYIRVSMAREEMISPQLQRAAIERAAEADKIVIPDDRWVEELDESGRGFGRKGVQTILRWAREGSIARVYVWKYSRFGRSARLVAVNVEQMEKAGCQLVSATEQVDARTAVGRFTRGMLWQLDEFYSDLVGESWAAAHAARLARGLPHSGAPRFGYVYHGSPVTGPCPQGCAPGECVTGYVPDPGTRPYVQRMYASYNGGMSVLKIAQWLNRKGIRTTAGKPWEQRSVRKYMDSGFAAGLLSVHDPRCEHATGRTGGCTRRVWVPGAHKAVISGTVWEEYLRQRKARAVLPPRAENPVYPLAGLVKCGLCHSPMWSHPMINSARKDAGGQPARYHLYHCSRYVRGRLCEGSWISRPRLEKVVRVWLASFEEDVKRAAEAEQRHLAAVDTAEADRRRLADEARSIEKELTELTRQLIRSIVPEAAYVATRDELTARQKEIGAELETLAAATAAAHKPLRRQAARLARDWDRLDPGAVQHALAALAARVEVTSHGRGTATVSIASTWGDVYNYSI
jgi:site-specific DNA recombinase